jgi:hypothetical protein
MIRSIKSHYIVILFIFIHILIQSVWIFNFSYLTHGDTVIYTDITQKELLDNFFIIYNNNYFGAVDIGGLSSRLIILFHGILANFDIYYNISIKIIYMIPFVVIAPIGLYLFLKKHTNFNNLAIFVSLSIYFFNTYIITLQTGHLLLLLATSLSWFIFYKVFDLIKNPNLNDTIILSIYALVVATYDFRIFYINTFIIALIYLFDLILNKKHNNKSILYLGLSYIVIFLLSFYWIYPLLKIDMISNNALFQRELFGDAFFNIKNSLTLNHPFWTGVKPAEFIVQEISLYKYVIPLFFVLSIMFVKKSYKFIVFVSIGLIGIFLSKQTASPLGFIYEFLFDNFPGFSAFREASKFYFLIAVSYSIVIPYFIQSIYKKSKNTAIFLSITLVFLFAYNTRPIITKEIETMFIPRNTYSDYTKFNSFISENNNIFRIISLPRESKWLSYSNEKSSLSSIYIIENNVWKDILNTDENINSSIEEKIIEIYKKDYSNTLLDNSNIKYVVVPIRDIGNDDNFFRFYGEQSNPNIRDWYINELDKIDWLEKKDLGFNELVVYENKDYKDRIYLTQEPETIYKDIPDKKVEFTQITPAEYKVKISNLDGVEYLNFVETFDPNWKIRIGDFDWHKVLYDNNYFINDSKHNKSEIGFNSFELSKDYIKANLDKSMYKENPDGSIDIELTLYFKPQSYFYLGIIISGTTLILCLSYLGYTFYRQRKQGILSKIDSDSVGE